MAHEGGRGVGRRGESPPDLRGALARLLPTEVSPVCPPCLQALQALWPHPSLHARLALLLSNRAAALLSQGKPLSALADCHMGLKYDPGLLRCALRVATCHRWVQGGGCA